MEIEEQHRENMQEKVIRFRISPELLVRYKVQCVRLELSVPKQTAELIRQFVEIQEDNEKRLKE